MKKTFSNVLRLVYDGFCKLGNIDSNVIIQERNVCEVDSIQVL